MFGGKVEYRVTFPLKYGSNTPGEKDPRERQGYYPQARCPGTAALLAELYQMWNEGGCRSVESVFDVQPIKQRVEFERWEIIKFENLRTDAARETLERLGDFNTNTFFNHTKGEGWVWLGGIGYTRYV